MATSPIDSISPSSSVSLLEIASWKQRLVARLCSKRFRAGMATAIFVSLFSDLCMSAASNSSLTRSITWSCPFITLSSLLTSAISPDQEIKRGEMQRDLPIDERIDWTKRALMLFALIYITYVVAQTVVHVPIDLNTFNNGLSRQGIISLFSLTTFALFGHLFAIAVQNRPKLAHAMLAAEGIHLALMNRESVLIHVAQVFAAGALTNTIQDPVEIEENC